MKFLKTAMICLALASTASGAQAAGNVRLQGAMVYSDLWTVQAESGNYPNPMNPGVYTVSAKPGGAVTMLHRVNDFYQIKAAINTNGIFYAITEQGEEGQYFLQSYSASTWTRNSKEEIDKCNVPSDITYDPVTKKYYGFFWSDDTQEYTRFCSWSPVYGEATDICEDMDRCCFAIAANKAGEIYGIWGYTGWLIKVNPKTGKYEQIGLTGVYPGENTNSLCFDDATGKLYWTACEERNSKGQVDRKSGIYEIDLTTGKATLLRDFDNNECFAGMWVLPYEMGDDVPMAPENVRITPDDVNHTLSWTAPAKKRNGEAQDPATLTYRVVDAMTGMDVLTDYKGTSWQCTLPQVDGHAAYQYTVYASNEEGEGEGAVSNKYYDGPGYNIPFVEGFDSREYFGYWSVIDMNGANTWQYDTVKKNIFNKYDDNNTAADEWIFSMPFYMEAGKTYELSFDANCEYDNCDKYAEDFEFWLAKGNEPELKTERIVRYDKFLSQDVQHKRVIFTPQEGGRTWLGIHTDSPATHWNLIIDNVGIREVNSNVPTAVTDLSLEPGAQGALTARLSWTTPTLDANGNALQSELTVSVYRDNDTEPVKVFDNTGTGKQMGWTDTPEASGMRMYRVVASTADGMGPEAEVSGFVGVDTPGSPQNLTVTEHDGYVELKWDAPVAGEHGGWFDATGLTYRIVRSNDAEVLSTDCAETAWNDLTLDLKKQTFLYYLVTTYSGTQKGGWANSASEIYGRAYTAPLAETFPKADMKWYPWISESDGPNYMWGLEEAGVNPECSDQNGDLGLVMMTSTADNAGVTGEFSSPKVNTSQLEKPQLGFWIWHSKAQDADKNEALQVLVRVQGGEWTPVGDPILRDNGTEGWQRHELPLPQADALRVMFRGKALGGGNIHLDNISFEEGDGSGVDGIAADDLNPVEWYTLQGVRIPAPEAPGVYIRRQGDKTCKVIR